MGNSDGRFVWYELATADIEAAKAFYTQRRGLGHGGCVDARFGLYPIYRWRHPRRRADETAAGRGRTGAAPQWIGYVGVDDVDAAARRVKKLGGTVHVPPADVPNVSRFSVIADPQMATLALITGRRRRPAAIRAAWCTRARGLARVARLRLGKGVRFLQRAAGWKRRTPTPSRWAHTSSSPPERRRSAACCTEPGTSPCCLWLYYFNVVGHRGGGETREGRRRQNPLWPDYSARRRSDRPLHRPSGRRLRSDRQACPHHDRMLFAAVLTHAARAAA